MVLSLPTDHLEVCWKLDSYLLRSGLISLWSENIHSPSLFCGTCCDLLCGPRICLFGKRPMHPYCSLTGFFPASVSYQEKYVTISVIMPLSSAPFAS